MSDRFLQRALYGFLQVTGIIAATRWVLRDKLLVVCIHGVVPDEGGKGEEPTRWQMRASELDRQLAILKEKYQFIGVEDVENVLENGRPGGKPCCLFTIDDGYSSAWEVAWPVLEKHGAPAIVFVATRQMTTGQPFWWDRLDYAMMHMPESTTEVEVGDHRLQVSLESRKARANSARHITRHSRELFDHEKKRFEALEDFIRQHEREEWLDDLKTWVGVMSANDVAEASDSGFEIGSHTVHHYRLGDLDREAVRNELQASKTELERVTGKSCRSFCFPEGSLNDMSREEVEAAGYEMAFCSDGGFNDSGSDRFALRRMHLPNGGSPAYLLARVTGIVAFVSKVRSMLSGGGK